MSRSRRCGCLSLLCAAAMGVPVLSVAAERDALLEGFRELPQAAQPRVWWHWMNGNITKDGIRRDLAWMKRVGIGGVNVIDASIGTPQVVRDRLVYMAPGWKDAFGYATALADHYGIELTTDTSPGWSVTGGPWVTPQQAMKKLVWSQTVVGGGQPFKGTLPRPPAIAGPFQDVAYVRRGGGVDPGPAPAFYADSAVVAYRIRAADPMPAPVTASSSSGNLDTALLSDGDLTRAAVIEPRDGQAWLELRYDRPVTVRSATLGTPKPGDPAVGAVSSPVMIGELQIQETDGNLKPVATLGITTCPEVTVSFPAVTAQVFRLNLSQGMPWQSSPPAPGVDPVYLGGAKADVSYSVSEFALGAHGRIHEFERKADCATADDYYALGTPPDSTDQSVARGDVVNLTTRMGADGSLDWTAPPGQWAILRLGYSLTGVTNYPASQEATGLEVDKLNRQHVSEYFDHYLGSYAAMLPSSLMGAHGLQGLMTDSTEVGPQNWTEDIIAQFRALRGYDPVPWLPTLTGVVIDSAAASDRFLWDFRRTIAQLTAASHYGGIAEAAHARSMKVYGEALENQRPVLGDDMEMRRYADVPTGAMWTFPAGGTPSATYIADDRGAASVAHLYGQKLVAAESFTNCSPAPWAFAPRDLKPVADLEFALGINRIIVHSSVHQPLEKPPGLSLFACAQFFNRHETWAEQAGGWMSYLARSSYLLQQGRYVADIAYFYGEEAPLTILQVDHRLDDVPTTYSFDYLNSEALLNLLTIQDGILTTPSGMRYRALQLGGTSRRMTLPVLRRIAELVRQGALVVGAMPVESPSLRDDQQAFDQLKTELWGPENTGAKIGAGEVIGTGRAEEVLAARGMVPDVQVLNPLPDTEVLSLHRTLSEGEIYFLTNRRNRDEKLEVSFRVAGKLPELWHAETGTREPASYRIDHSRTVVSLSLRPLDAVFVVFRKPALSASRVLSSASLQPLGVKFGPWTLRFQRGRGAPAQIRLRQLSSWSDSTDSRVKYFSGTGTYSTTLHVPAGLAQPAQRLMLDLGDVRELAEVTLNGHHLRVSWMPPYQIDVTRVLRPGMNRLEIRVTNLWVNRLIGDQQPGARQYAFTTLPTYTHDAPLRPSGLLGPVTLIQVRRGATE